MRYILVVFLLGESPAQIGPFDNIFACEQAAEQIKLASLATQRARGVCVNLKAKPHHWNGKPVPK